MNRFMKKLLFTNLQFILNIEIDRNPLLTSITTNNHDNNNGNKIYEIYGNHQDAHKAILESPIFDSVELITYACTNSNPSYENKPIRHCSLRHVPCDVLLKSGSTSESLRISSNDSNKTSSIIFCFQNKNSIISKFNLSRYITFNQSTC